MRGIRFSRLRKRSSSSSKHGVSSKHSVSFEHSVSSKHGVSFKHSTSSKHGIGRRLTGGPASAAVTLLVTGGLLAPATLAAAATSGTPSRAATASRPSAPGKSATGKRAAGTAASAFNWPEFHRSAELRGFAYNSPLTTTSAATLGIGWAADLYGAALDSPVVAYAPSLKMTLAYIGTERGDVIAVNVANGQIVWATWLGSPIRTTPVVSDGSVYVGTFNSPRIYKLAATSGAISCSASAPQPIEGTPVVADPPGGVRTLYVGTNDSARAVGPVLAINATNCKLEWSFSHYRTLSGSWTPVAYTVDAKKTPLILFGSADTDAGEYALNAVTGAKVWQYFTQNPAPHTFDVGAGAAISQPGQLGFKDGVAYVPTKFGIMYALDLTTGHLIWSTNFNKALNAHEGGRSTAALDGTDLVFGYSEGVIDLNAVTGAMMWVYKDPAHAEALSSPAIAGPNGSQIVAVGDLSGGVEVLSLATGQQLYHFQTGGYVTASPAVSDGDIIIASSDGFLYDFVAGGGNDTSPPSTTITTPSDFSSVANPDGDLTVKGTAADTSAVGKVEVAVQENRSSGDWWDAATGRWVSGPVGNSAAVASPGTGSSAWTFSYPVPASGGTYSVTATAYSSTGQPDLKGGQSRFSVLASTAGTHITPASRFAAPGGQTAVTGGGFKAGEKVAISVSGQALATATADGHGDLPRTTVTIPASATFGLTTLTATGTTSHRSAGAAITIANNWDQVGYGHGHGGFEPNDPSLSDLVHVGPGLFLDPAWQYQSGAPIDTAPAVADSVAYIANTAGQLSAIDVHNGSPIWTWTLPSGQAIDGSPAVDPSAGLVFVGASDGTADAVSIASGKLAWSTTVGGDVSAPVYGDGEVYVTSSNDEVAALRETKGTKTWAKTVPGVISEAPALASASKALAVSQSGGVAELDSQTGAQRWAFKAGGTVASAPDLSGQTVYFGSASGTTGGTVYAVNAGTGAKRWATPTTGAVADTPSLITVGTSRGVPEIIAGSNDGTIHILRASNGATLFEDHFKEPVTGVSTVKGVGVLSTSSGLVGAFRTYTDLNIWRFQAGGAVMAPPAIVDGAVYFGSQDGKLYAFTTYGQLPGSDTTPGGLP